MVRLAARMMICVLGGVLLPRHAGIPLRVFLTKWKQVSRCKRKLLR